METGVNKKGNMRLNDWTAEAMEYRDFDIAAQQKAERLIAAETAFLKYAKRIRNAGKREFALAYARFRFGNSPYPDETASYIACQAVRHRAESCHRQFMAVAK